LEIPPQDHAVVFSFAGGAAFDVEVGAELDGGRSRAREEVVAVVEAADFVDAVFAERVLFVGL